MGQPLQFDYRDDIHEYRVDGVVVPSVTQILSGCRIADLDGVPELALNYKSELGTQVHAFCHYLDDDDADWGQVSGTPLEPYCRGYERFRRETTFTPRLLEHQRVAVVNGQRYGMKLDREGYMAGRETILEIKCTAADHASHGVQLAAYDMGLRELGRPPRQRVVVRLLDNGNYALRLYRDPMDEKAFLWALALTTWKATVKL